MTLSLFLGETTDGVIVLAIVLGSVLLGFVQEYRAGNAVARLLAVIETRVTVLRDGREVELPQDVLVPGDVIVLAGGAAVPADCRILGSTDLFVDESTVPRIARRERYGPCAGRADRREHPVWRDRRAASAPLETEFERPRRFITSSFRPGRWSSAHLENRHIGES